MPALLEHFALNTLLEYNRLIEQSEQMMILMRGNMMQCALTELDGIQERSLAWSSAYHECQTSSTPTTTETTSETNTTETTQETSSD